MVKSLPASLGYNKQKSTAEQCSDKCNFRKGVPQTLARDTAAALRDCCLASRRTTLFVLVFGLQETAPAASPRPTQQCVQDVHCQLRHKTDSGARSTGSFHMSAARNFVVGVRHSHSKELSCRELNPGLPRYRREY